MITGMDFVSLPVTDMAAAKAFYTDVLGLKLGHATPQWTELDLGPGPALALVDMAHYGMGTEPVRAGSVALAVAELEGVLAKLRAMGLADQEAPYESPVCHVAFARDPHGNALALHRRKEDPGAEGAIDFVHRPSTDAEAHAAFYTDVLGLERAPGTGAGWVEFVLPDGSALALADPTGLGIEPTPVTTGWVGLHVPELEALFEKVKALGHATRDEILETPVCHMAFVKDPAGNGLVLHRHK
jgi:catechol 2,3-dioxygenase-like lactoylglutathione lyase family enzyme